MPDGTPACLTTILEQQHETREEIGKLRDDLKPIIADFHARRGRDQFFRDVGATLAGAAAFIGGGVALASIGEKWGWWK